MLNRLPEPIRIPIRTEGAFNQLREPILIEILNPLHEPELIILEPEVAVVQHEVVETTYPHQAHAAIQITQHLHALAQVHRQ